ncbi:O-antigen ligase family protein [Nocardioides nitrophenolicus]|uniref:O-antigen ligase family protein n=1 Tax=Nocardioides nitrophenolicus TaxID=60489 RepID=UPI00195C1779|nr:O-antigen ligase family protein [Nocardioides nitrophenolicus]MBM7520308.1 O-antigen ligase [Nocardioides nitrophenolicus]
MTLPARPPVPALAVMAVIAVLPFGGAVSIVLSVAFLAMALPAAIALWFLVTDQRPVPASLLLLGLGLGVVTSLVAAAGGVNPGEAVIRVVIACIALGYAVGIAMAHRPGFEHGGLDLLVVMGGCVGAYALSGAGALQAAAGGWVVDGRLTGPFSQPNELGIFCAGLLPVAVTCLVTARSRARTVVLAVATSSIVLAWVLSMSRGAWIGGCVALVAIAIAVPRTRRLLRRAGAAAVATCVLALVLPTGVPLLGILGTRLRSMGNTGANEYDARPLIWGEAWRQISDHPWFGVGPDGYRVAATDSVSTVSAYGADHAHDLYLTVLVERGVIGMTAGIVVLAGCLVAGRRHLLAQAAAARVDDQESAVLSARSLAVLAGLLAIAVHGVFDMPLWNPIVYVFTWTLLGMAIVAETVPLAGSARAAVPTVRTPQQEARTTP